MRFPDIQHQDDRNELASFLRQISVGTLVTVSELQPKVGLYNYLYTDDSFYIHIGRKDEQALQLQRNPNCQFVFSEVLSVIPSFWIDERYGGAINNFFKYLEFDCTARFISETGETLKVMQRLLDHYQATRRYDPLDTESEIYREKFAMITMLELTVKSSRSKWNFGQAKPRAAFLNIIRQLELRREPKDEQTALEMRKWLERVG